MRSAVVGNVSWRKDSLDGRDCVVDASDAVNTRSEAVEERRN